MATDARRVCPECKKLVDVGIARVPGKIGYICCECYHEWEEKNAR